MNISEKIEEAIKQGRLISYEEHLQRYSPAERAEIKRRARYLRAAMELRRLRRQVRLSQEKLAQKMKVKREVIARIESGRQNVTLETLYHIAEVTGKKFVFTFR